MTTDRDRLGSTPATLAGRVDRLFRSTVDMARHRFGRGQYRYFAEPLPARRRLNRNGRGASRCLGWEVSRGDRIVVLSAAMSPETHLPISWGGPYRRDSRACTR